MRPSDSLHALANLYEERNKLYGDCSKNFGKMFTALFPNGILITDENDANRMALFVHIITKVGRYANNWRTGHVDSLNDIAVYTQMLQELDEDLLK
jgi:hypothetical protein